MFLNRQEYRRIDRIIGKTAVAQVQVPIVINGKSIRINSITGNTWINPKGNADNTGVNSYQIVPGGYIEINVDGTLNMISDATGSNVQIIVFE